MNAFETSQFGLTILSQLPADENAVLSPMSLAAVTALLFCGARNVTRSELASKLHLSDSAVDRLSAAMHQALASVSGDLARLRCSTAIYATAHYPVDPSYAVDIASRLFSSTVSSLDFANQPEASREHINAWIATETADLIRNMLPPGSVSSLTVALVASAVHFKGLWLEPFNVKQTRPSDFRVNDSRVVSVQMMYLSSRLPHAYSKEHKLQLLRLPYSGTNSNLSMLLFLPMKGVSLESVLDNLAGRKEGPGLASLVSNMSPVRVAVNLPRFSLSATVDVKEVLSAMGIISLFAKDADLTAMCPGGGVNVSSFLHRAVIEVNEEGTQAAAATVASVQWACGPVCFICDRPFAFAIWHEPTASAIFLGKVVDPTT